MTNESSHRRRMRVGLVGLMTAAIMTMLPVAPAAAAPVDFPRGTTLEGLCTGELRAIALPVGGPGLWSPYLVYFPDLRRQKLRLLVPYELRVNADGATLKSRHLVPGEELNVTRTPPTGANLIKCQFTSDFLVDGQPAHVGADINGVLLPS